MADTDSPGDEAMQQQRPGLPSTNLSNNVRAMSRSCPLLSAILLATAVFACNDELTQDVDEDVCLSMGPAGEVLPGRQWIGGRRASPEMYPGRDCVGCHLDNDGPELMFGGTVYPYVEQDFSDMSGFTVPTGDDCYGLEGVTVRVIGGDGQEYVTITNAAGNFFVEGKASDLKKPFKVYLNYTAPNGAPLQPEMFTPPSYGGCGRCHSLDAQPFPARGESSDGISADERVQPAGSKIGVPNILQLGAMN